MQPLVWVGLTLKVYELVDITGLPRWHTPCPYVRTGYRTQVTETSVIQGEPEIGVTQLY